MICVTVSKPSCEVTIHKRQHVKVDTQVIVRAVDAPVFEGPYMVTPRAHSATVLPTEDHLMSDDVTVVKIPYTEIDNDSGGLTVNIAEE